MDTTGNDTGATKPIPTIPQDLPTERINPEVYFSEEQLRFIDSYKTLATSYEREAVLSLINTLNSGKVINASNIMDLVVPFGIFNQADAIELLATAKDIQRRLTDSKLQ